MCQCPLCSKMFPLDDFTDDMGILVNGLCAACRVTPVAVEAAAQPVVPVTKTCSACGVTKPVAAFAPRKDRPSGYASQCRECYRGKQRSSYAAEKVDSVTGAAGPRPAPFTVTKQMKRLAQYGLTQVRVDEMLEQTMGMCAGKCGTYVADGIYVVDHDHACCPGRSSCGDCVRALLCASCNRVLGMARDDAVRLRGLADVLDAYKVARDTNPADMSS